MTLNAKYKRREYSILKIMALVGAVRDPKATYSDGREYSESKRAALQQAIAMVNVGEAVDEQSPPK